MSTADTNCQPHKLSTADIIKFKKGSQQTIKVAAAIIICTYAYAYNRIYAPMHITTIDYKLNGQQQIQNYVTVAKIVNSSSR